MTPTIVGSIARAPERVIRRLEAAGVSTIHEAQERSGLLQPQIRPTTYLGARMAGSAVTVLCAPGDNLMIHAALAVVQPGDVLVVGTTEESTCGLFGELLAESARARGVVGLVIDAGLRDTAEIAALQFPCWAKAISAQGSTKNTAGSVNIPMVCAGASVSPGDVVVADSDGVVIVPRESAERVAAAAELRLQDEAEKRRRLRAGELTIDLYGLRDVLARVGVTWETET